MKIDLLGMVSTTWGSISNSMQQPGVSKQLLLHNHYLWCKAWARFHPMPTTHHYSLKSSDGAEIMKLCLVVWHDTSLTWMSPGKRASNTCGVLMAVGLFGSSGVKHTEPGNVRHARDTTKKIVPQNANSKLYEHRSARTINNAAWLMYELRILVPWSTTFPLSCYLLPSGHIRQTHRTCRM